MARTAAASGQTQKPPRVLTSMLRLIKSPAAFVRRSSSMIWSWIMSIPSFGSASNVLPAVRALSAALLGVQVPIGIAMAVSVTTIHR